MQVLNIFHVLIAISMVAFVLVQRGPGATAGAAFGSGASGTVFGARGAGSFLSRATWFLGAAFCLISMTMAVVVSRDVVNPEIDLGVVGTAPVIEETIPEEPLYIPIPEQAESDLPVLDSSDAVADGLPAMDAGAEVEDADAVGETEESSDSDS